MLLASAQVRTCFRITEDDVGAAIQVCVVACAGLVAVEQHLAGTRSEWRFSAATGGNPSTLRLLVVHLGEQFSDAFHKLTITHYRLSASVISCGSCIVSR